MIIAVIVLSMLVLALAALLVLRKPAPPDTQSSLMLKQDLGRLSDDITKLKDGLQVQLTDRLDKNQEMMRDSLQKQFGASHRIISEVTEKLTKLDETNKRVVDVADELKMLQNILQNPKQRGGLGEYYLENVLSNVMTTKNYETQYKFKDGEIVDAVIKLDKGRLLSIDSKFSLENYNRLIEAKDKTERDNLAKLFRADLKNRIDETSKYIRPAENTLDYAFMFIPSEAIYYDLLVNKVGTTTASARDLIEYAFIDKKVIIVSPTTLLAYLQTVLQGLKSLQIEGQAKDIQKKVAELGRHIAVHESFMQKLGNSLGTTVGHFNNAHKELKKMDKDVVSIAEVSPGVEPLLLDRPTDTDI